jgi:hypothetical protein
MNVFLFLFWYNRGLGFVILPCYVSINIRRRFIKGELEVMIQYINYFH